MKNVCTKLALPALAVLWITGCASAPVAGETDPVTIEGTRVVDDSPAVVTPTATEAPAEPGDERAASADKISLGSGDFVQGGGSMLTLTKTV